MRKFAFRLQAVLDFRVAEEEAARLELLRVRAERLEAEAELARLNEEKWNLAAAAVGSISDYQDRQFRQEAIAQKIHEQGFVIQVIEGDENIAMRVWREKKQEMEAMLKLRTKALEAYELEASRAEQAELDEWAVLRRAS